MIFVFAKKTKCRIVQADVSQIVQVHGRGNLALKSRHQRRCDIDAGNPASCLDNLDVVGRGVTAPDGAHWGIFSGQKGAKAMEYPTEYLQATIWLYVAESSLEALAAARASSLLSSVLGSCSSLMTSLFATCISCSSVPWGRP